MLLQIHLLLSILIIIYYNWESLQDSIKTTVVQNEVRFFFFSLNSDGSHSSVALWNAFFYTRNQEANILLKNTFLFFYWDCVHFK